MKENPIEKEKELERMSRGELIQFALAQARENRALKAQLAGAKADIAAENARRASSQGSSSTVSFDEGHPGTDVEHLMNIFEQTLDAADAFLK